MKIIRIGLLAALVVLLTHPQASGRDIGRRNFYLHGAVGGGLDYMDSGDFPAAGPTA